MIKKDTADLGVTSDTQEDQAKGMGEDIVSVQGL